jgi:hypothetical protein
VDHIGGRAVDKLWARTLVVGSVRGCNGCLRSTMNLYINKKEKTKEKKTLYYSSINTNIFLSCLGNISIVR